VSHLRELESRWGLQLLTEKSRGSPRLHTVPGRWILLIAALDSLAQHRMYVYHSFITIRSTYISTTRARIMCRLLLKAKSICDLEVRLLPTKFSISSVGELSQPLNIVLSCGCPVNKFPKSRGK
jgi:hypothetical protein